MGVVRVTPQQLYSRAGIGAPGIHWIGSWVGPRTDLDAVAKKKISSLFLPGTELQ
jgi:hypothetical protein